MDLESYRTGVTHPIRRSVRGEPLHLVRLNHAAPVDVALLDDHVHVKGTWDGFGHWLPQLANAQVQASDIKWSV